MRVEKEQTDWPHPGIAAHVDVHDQPIADLEQPLKGYGIYAEQPVDTLPLVFKVHAQPRDEHKVGLTHLHGDTARDMAVVEVPSVLLYDRLGPELSFGAHGLGDGIDP